MNTQSSQHPDNIFFNINIRNPYPNSNIDATYFETKVQDIIPGCLSDYECAVARMKIPSDSIPIFVFENNSYLVTLTDNTGLDHSVYCQFVPNNSSSVVAVNFIWQFTEFTQSINNALNTAWNNIPALNRPSAPPFILFNQEKQLFSLYATNEYNSVPNDNTKTQIWFNFNLSSKLSYFHVYYNSVPNGTEPNKYANLLILPLGDNHILADTVTFNSQLNAAPALNGIIYFKLEQQQISTFLLSDFNNLILKCNNLPVVPEQNSSSNGSSDNFQQVLTTFEPVLDPSFNNGSYLQYQPAQYRWFSLPSCLPLKSMDLYIFWSTVNGTNYPIRISYNRIATVLLYFRKKHYLY